MNNAPIATGLAGDRVDYVAGGGAVRVDAGANAAISDADNNGFDVERVGSGFGGGVLDLTPVPGSGGRVFVAEKSGRLSILDPATGVRTTFLDLSGQISTGGERGLLGVAAAPDYAASGRIYLFVTNSAGDIEVRRYTRSATDPNVADAGSGDLILRVPHPTYDNHNGGWMAFGPDGMLYVATGDGGGGGDPDRNAQNTNSLLGKILRLDVSGDAFPNDPLRDYLIPSDNPFAAGGGAGEIWAYGLRNPFRNSFDAAGNLYIADVGQGAWEEVNRLAPGDGRANFGWSILEGTHSFHGGSTAGLTAPILEYGHGSGPLAGRSITGGYVYAGPVEALRGKYFFGDFVSANIWAVPVSQLSDETTLGTSAFELFRTAFAPDTGRIDRVASFGVDAAGNLHILDFADGEIYRIAASSETNFAAGSLRVAITGGKVAGQDRLGIDGASGITLSNGTAFGSEVRLGGVLIGTLAGSGAGAEDLVIAFSSGATPARVSELLRSISYANDAGAAAVGGSRTLTFTVIDGAGTASGGQDRTMFSSSVVVRGADGSLSGDAGNNSIAGTDGDDLFRLAAGGDDSASGAAGNDIFFYGAALTAADRNNGGEGNDTLVLQGNYDLTLGADNLLGIEGLSLQSGSITRWGQSGTNSYDYVLRSAEANVAAGQQFRVNAQSLRAGEDFSFDGSAETDGTFLVYAGYGDDNLTGGANNDIFFFEAGRFGAGDRVTGGAGRDAVVISGTAPATTGPLVLAIGPGQLSGIESISFNARFNSEPGSSPSYEVTLASGNVAPGGTLIVNASSLGAGQSLGFDASAEGAGRFQMFGGAGSDVLTGGGAADLIFAAGGIDTLRGGGGADLFQYRTTSDSANGASDFILDFEFGSDRIDLAFIDANSAAGGNQAFTFIGGQGFHNVAGELRASRQGDRNDWLIQADVNGDGVADLEIRVTTTTAGSFGENDLLL
jgi:hypothetical protein